MKISISLINVHQLRSLEGGKAISNVDQDISIESWLDISLFLKLYNINNLSLIIWPYILFYVEFLLFKFEAETRDDY